MLFVAISDYAFVDNEMTRKYNFRVCSTALSLQLYINVFFVFFYISVEYLFICLFLYS